MIMNNDNINNKANQNISPEGETERGRYGAAECGDCNTCGKCDEQLQEEEAALFDAVVRAAAAKERNSFEKNLARERRSISIMAFLSMRHLREMPLLVL